MFSFLRNAWKTNPARVVNWVGGLIPAVFAVLTAFGVTFSEDQQVSLSGLFAAFTAIFIIGGEAIRSQVTPFRSTATEQFKRPLVKDSYLGGPGGSSGQANTNLVAIIAIVVIVVLLVLVVL